jgi:hypothetical protein
MKNWILLSFLFFAAALIGCGEAQQSAETEAGTLITVYSTPT